MLTVRPILIRLGRACLLLLAIGLSSGYAQASSLSDRLNQVYSQQSAAAAEFKRKDDTAKQIWQTIIQLQANQFHTLASEFADPEDVADPLIQKIITMNPERKAEIREVWLRHTGQMFNTAMTFLLPHFAAAYADTFSLDVLNKILTGLQAPLTQKINNMLVSFCHIDQQHRQQCRQVMTAESEAVKQGNNLLDSLENDPVIIKSQKEFDAYLQQNLTPDEFRDLTERRAFVEQLRANRTTLLTNLQNRMSKESKYNFASFALEIAGEYIRMVKELQQKGITLPQDPRFQRST